MRMLTSGWVVCVFVAAQLDAAPIRTPLGKTEPDETPMMALDRLDNDGGVRLGDWSIWRFDGGGKSYFIVNHQTGLGMYLYWGSNGWVNYRTSEGTWMVLFPTGTPSPQDRRDLDIQRFLGKRANIRIAPGKYMIQNWAVTVTGDTIEFDTKNVPSTIRLQANSPEFTHNGRSISK